MRFFPRDAFEKLSDNPVQIPEVQVQFQQFQQMQQQMQQQISMPMAVPQVSIMDPMLLYNLQVLAQGQALAMLMALQTGMLRLHPQRSDPDWYLMGLSSFGYPGY